MVLQPSTVATVLLQQYCCNNTDDDSGNLEKDDRPSENRRRRAGGRPPEWYSTYKESKRGRENKTCSFAKHHDLLYFFSVFK